MAIQRRVPAELLYEKLSPSRSSLHNFTAMIPHEPDENSATSSKLPATGANPVWNIIISSDAKGIEPNATLVGSLLFHSKNSVHIRLFTREFAAQTILSGQLTLEIVPTPEQYRLEGRVPSHVSAGGTFDRIVAIPYCTDWDRAVILDYDQVVARDPSALFDIDLEDALVAGRLWPGQTLGVACREWFGRELPAGWQDCGSYRYFYMGPVLNLSALRASDAYQRFLEFHTEANMEEQIALHVACRDRLLELPADLNAVPQWDGVGPSTKILHFTGPAKPWNTPELVGAPIWRLHETTWEELTCGLWNPSQEQHLRLVRCRESAVAREENGVEVVTIEDLSTIRSASVARLSVEEGFLESARGELAGHFQECHRILGDRGELIVNFNVEDESGPTLVQCGWTDEKVAVCPGDLGHAIESDANHLLPLPELVTRASLLAGFQPHEIFEWERPREGSSSNISMLVRKTDRNGEPIPAAVLRTRAQLPSMRMLEIGGWDLPEKHRVARLWMEHMDDRWTVVFRTHPDPSALHQGIGRFSAALGDFATRTEILDGNSVEVLAWLLTREDGWESFDVIVLHAPRRPEEFLTEACMAWRLLSSGGTMVINPVARKPGPVGRLLFEQSLRSFMHTIGDSILSHHGTHEVTLIKAS